jgi:hypothetical protein
MLREGGSFKVQHCMSGFKPGNSGQPVAGNSKREAVTEKIADLVDKPNALRYS